MDSSNLVAGVPPGGFRDTQEVRILICYLLNAVKQPLSKEQLNHIFNEQNLVQYFVFSDALAKLVSQKQVEVETIHGEEYFTLTSLGETTAQMLQSSLPRTVRDRVVSATMTLLHRRKIEQETKVETVPMGAGFEVRFTIHEKDVNLMKFSMFVPDMTQAELIQNRFLSDPVEFYQRVIGYLVCGTEKYPK